MQTAAITCLLSQGCSRTFERRGVVRKQIGSYSILKIAKGTVDSQERRREFGIQVPDRDEPSDCLTCHFRSFDAAVPLFLK
jgi:hypothetical protein